MIKRVISLAALLALSVSPLAAQSDGRPHDTISPIEVQVGDREMNVARAEAQRTLPGFLKLLANPPAGTSDYGVKFPLEGTEHIWVGNLRREGTFLIGELSNFPELPGYTMGQEVRVPISQVDDWTYVDSHGVAQGHFTTRVLLGRLAPEDAANARKQLGWTQ